MHVQAVGKVFDTDQAVAVQINGQTDVVLVIAVVIHEFVHFIEPGCAGAHRHLAFGGGWHNQHE
jgi:hypothetical protein